MEARRYQAVDMIHHVQVDSPPGSETISRAYYGALLGLTEIAKPPALAARGGCWFRGNEIELHLGIGRKAHPGLLWPALDALAVQLDEAGHEVSWSDELPGFRRFHTFDPHGNRLEFLAPR